MNEPFPPGTLVDPETHEPLTRATRAQLDALSDALAKGRVRRHDGGPLPVRIDGAYLSRSGRWVYADTDGIPSLLIEERLELDAPLG